MRKTLALFAALILSTVAVAQERPSDTLLTVEHYLDWEQVADPQISPDGAQILYTRRWVNRVTDQWDAAVWIMSADGSRNRFLIKGSNARWSPDGTRILFTADGEPRGTQIFVRWMDAEGATSQVTRLTATPSSVRWAPDGRWISFGMLVPDTAPAWRISLPAAPSGATWTAPPRVVDRLHYRQDQRGFMDRGFMHLFVVPSEGGTPRQLTRGAWHAGARGSGLDGGLAHDWMPDGRTIVFAGNMDERADLQYRETKIYAVDVATTQITRLTQRPGSWNGPQVAPDGRTIAFTGTDSAWYSYRAAQLWLMNADGSNQRSLSGTLDRDPGSITWAADGSGLYFAAQDRGAQNLHFAALRGGVGGVRQLTEGAHLIQLGSIGRNGLVAAIRTDPDEPPDVVTLDVRAPRQINRLTRVNEDVLGRIRLGQVEEIWYTSSGGARVQGWVVKPPHFDASRRYPLIMEIHGGPHGMYGVGFNYQFQNFAANGYVVLYTNPRGSTGYGSDFGNAIYRAYPSVDYDDLMAGVDTVVGRGYIDGERMYVGGCSGGGVLSSWVIGHTNRFAAAAVRCPVINWMSMAGNTDIPLFTYNFFERPFWEDPQPWLRQSSLMYVGNVTTPTLLMTGEQDLRTPMPQTEEFFSALKMRGVPTVLLRFNNQYHGTGTRPSNFMRTQLYMMSWYQRYRRTAAAAVIGN
jgi:dipeptidyl aminopeptidase/acylaminoacyl peptidase